MSSIATPKTIPTTAKIATLTTPDGSEQILPRTLAKAVITDSGKTVEEALAGAGDMLARTYDPQGKAQDAFQYADDALELARGDIIVVDRKISDHCNDMDNPHETTAEQVSAIPTAQKGAAGGVAELDIGGKVPAAQLPSYVDDVLEYSTRSAFPTTGEGGKIYVSLDTNLTWRWSGSAYVEISPSIALGETSGTAYRGDRGKAAYDHISDAAKHITAAERTAWNAKETTTGAQAKANTALAAAKTYADGKSAYQQAKEGGYAGTEAEFKAILASGPWRPESWVPTPEEIGAAVKSSQVNTTLTAAGWSGARPFTQTLAVTGLLAGQSGDIGLAQSATAAQREAARSAILSVTGQAAGGLTITADGDKPTVALPVTVTLLG